MSDGIELRWPGKFDEEGRRCPVPRPGAVLSHRVGYRATTPSADEGEPNLLVEGDNLLALDALVRERPESVDLIYIDPPFATGGRFEVVTAVGPRPTKRGSGPQVRQPAYTDSWPGGVGGLLAMLDPRLRLLHQLLSAHGSLYIHVDPTVGHAVKLLLDEIFGPGCFQREIVWRIGWVSGFKTRARNWIRNHDLIFFYVKDPARFTFNKHYMPHPPGYRRRDGSLPRGKGVPLDDVWNAGEAELRLRGAQSLDSIQIKSFSTEKTGYATQKNESLLRRIIEASSNPGDTVADVFCGSGTTLRVAESLGRRWIGCDTGRAAVEIATRRMLAGPRRRGVEVCTVAPDERRQWLAQLEETGGSLAEHLQARWSAVAGDDGGPLALRDDDTQTVPSRGEGALAAWRWHVPVPIAEDEAGVLVGEPWPPTGKGAAAARRAPSQWVLQRALFDPRLDGQPAMGLAERARMVVRLRGLRTGSIAVELVALVYPHEDRLPVALPEGPRGALDLVERWSVTWNEQGQRPVDDVLGRFDRARVLPHETPIHRYRGRSARLVVRVDDALHREHRLVCMLTRGTAGWTVEAAHAEAEA